MRTLTLFSALLSVLLSTLGLLSTPAQALEERYSTSHGDRSRQYGIDRPRAVRPSDARSGSDRFRAERHSRDYRHDDYRRNFTYPYKSWRYGPNYRYYGKHGYMPPRYYDYPSHRHYHLSNDFWGWLAFTAITLAIIDNLNEQQQREHELALHGALRSPVGETIHWMDNDASGSVTVIRDGTSSAGRYCREYTQEIRIGGESQRAYGTACRNLDGSWEIMD